MPLNKEIKPSVDLSVWPDLVNSYYLREVNEKYPHEREPAERVKSFQSGCLC